MENGVEAKKNKYEDTPLETLRARFKQAHNHEKEWRKNKKLWCRYYDGDQLTTEEKEELKKRGQPEVVINRIKPRIDAIVGIQITNKVKSKAFPRGRNDAAKNTAITESFRYIDQRTTFERHETKAFEELLIAGRSWYKTEPDFDGLEVEIKTQKVDCDDIYLDPHCRKADLSDAKHIFETVWMDLEDAKLMWPDMEEELEMYCADPKKYSGASPHPMTVEKKPDQYKQGGDDEGVNEDELFVDQKRRRVRIVTAWYKKPLKRTVAMAKGMEPEDISDLSASKLKLLKKVHKDLQTLEKIEWQMCALTFAGKIELDHKEDVTADGDFPFTLVPCYVTHDDKRQPYAFVKQMIHSQDECNKRRSKALHFSIAERVFMEKGAVDNVNDTRIQLAKPDGIIVVNPAFKFEIQKNLELQQVHYQMLQEAKNEIDESGINREIAGQGSNSQSGKAIQLKALQANTVIRPLFDELRDARKRVAQKWLAIMQKYWTNQKVINITDDSGAIKEIILNERQMDPNTGEEVILNNVALGKYDVIIEEVPDTINLQSEQFQSLVQLATSGIPIPPDLIIEASTLPNKERLLESVRGAMQQQEQAQAAEKLMELQGQMPQAPMGNA